MIKFWAVHHKTMELYTLWGNGGLLASFLQNLNSKVSEATPNDCIGWSSGNILPEDLDKIMLYQRNRTKLALLLLIIVEKCHAHALQHNDLSPNNILLHFPSIDKTKIFWGVCDWRWLAALAKWLHQIMVFKLLMKSRGNDNYGNILHQSHFMFLDHVDQKHV